MSKLKPAIYYALIRRGWNNYHGYRVLTVTTEKRRIVYGRLEGDEPTNCSIRDIKAKFDTLEKANEAIRIIGMK